MRWNFGGNLQPVRMICEYDWKECPIAVVSYIWSEIVTDVVDTVTGEAYLWRFLAIMLLCSMLLHTIYYKSKWVNKSEEDLARDHLVKVGFKIQDLELKINILTYKMQYGTWPLPHEIPTPSLNELRNVKITLSNTSRQNMWTKHHLHGYISKCIRNSEDDKSMTRLLSKNEDVDLTCQNFLSKFESKNEDIETLRYERNLKLLSRGRSCKDYKRLFRTAEDCRKYMDEINESNKSLGLLENLSDISDQNSAKDISAGTESEKNSHRFLIDPKKWHEIYKYKTRETEEASDSDLTTSNQMFTTFSNAKHKDMAFSANEEKQLSKNTDRSRLLPPGLSITFLSDKFKTFASSDQCVSGEGTKQSRNKTSTNETLNKVKEKLESLHDIKQVVKNSKSLSNVCGGLENKKGSEISLSIKTSSKLSSLNRGGKYDKKELCNVKKFDKLISSECNSSSGDNGATLDPLPVQVSANKIPVEYSKSINDRRIHESNNQNAESVFKTMNNSFGNITRAKNTLDSNFNSENIANTNLNNTKINVQNPPREFNEISENLVIFPMKVPLVKNLAKIAQREESLSSENDSSTSFGINSNPVRKKQLNAHKAFGLKVNEQRAQDKMQTETDEDANMISPTSSRTELSKDSDTDDKSTTTLLREALEFKKALLIQIQRENELCDEKNLPNESSECESDDTSRSKTENHYRSKLLDIISEEQSAGSSTEKTSRTYILSRAINDTNLCDGADKYLTRNDKGKDLKSNNVTPEAECCSDLKSAVAASSSEYFSINNATDNEHISAQIINQCVAEGDECRELELNFAKNNENNNINQDFDIELKNYDVKEVDKCFAENKSQDNLKRQTATENNRTVNSVEEIDKSQESCENSSQKIEDQVDSVSERIVTKSEGKIKLFKSMSSIDSEKGISWNSISESSSSESISQFVNALAKLESKSIDRIAEEKLMMLNSRDIEGRNFATAGEDLRYGFDSCDRKRISDLNQCKQSDGVIGEILEMISDSPIFKLETLETKEQKNTGNQSEGSNLFNSHSVLKLDQERLQRKQEIFSKLKTLDAFTKPLDISECNSEKNENEGENDTPLTGRTVVCTSNSNTTNAIESKNATSSEILVANKEIELSEEKSEQRCSDIKFDGREETEETDRAENDCKTATILQSRKILSNTKRSQLSKSSITNFSTDTSDSYFDVSNHDFAVSSIILTSQNSNLVSKRKEDRSKSDTSSSYVDASDYCSKIASNSSLREENTTSNLSESQMVNVNANEIEEIKTEDREIEKEAKIDLMPKCTSSLPSNDKKSEIIRQGETLNRDHLSVKSSSSLDQDSSEYRQSLSLEKMCNRKKVRAKSRSCIPVLKSRIDGQRIDKSMEAKARSRSPVRRSNTPTIQGTESNCEMGTSSSNNENEKRMRQSIYGSRRSLNKKQSYILRSKNSEIREKGQSTKPESEENKETKITRSISSELNVAPEKPSLLNTPGQLTKECTVIYINIISDLDRDESQAIEGKEMSNRVNEKDAIAEDKKLDPTRESLSLRNMKSDRSSESKHGISVASHTSDSKLWKNIFNDLNNGNEENLSATRASIEAEKLKDSVDTNDVERVSELSGIVTTKANKLLSTSTLELSNSSKIDKREMEVSAKPSVKNTSTSVSDFPDVSPEEKRSFYNPKNEVFDVSKDFLEKDKIVLSEMLTSDPNFFECRKTHRLYNKLGLGFQEQTDQL